MSHHTEEIGFGDKQAVIKVYVEKRPPLVEFQQLSQVTPLTYSQLQHINEQAGNGWRKLFNVYAKWLFELNLPQFSHFSSWQQLREQYLLQAGSKTALLFSPPQLTNEQSTLHIIAGRTYAKQLIADNSLSKNLIWLDNEFAIDAKKRLIVCPYFDYRQLSNRKITFLCELSRVC